MSNETMEKEDQELEELKQQIEQQASEAKEKAADPVEPEKPSPESEAPQAPEPIEEAPATVTPNQSKAEASSDAQPKDDPMEWAKKKGFKTPEDMARALLQKEQEFHQSRQKAEREAPPPPPPSWQPAPQMGYGYPPAPSYPPPFAARPDTIRQIASMYPQLAPEDVERIMPLIVDTAQSAARRERFEMEQRFGHIERSTQRNNELMSLMQDPAFRDERVQKEVHQILDSDPAIFQRERTPLVYAYGQALQNMARKQLQQGVSNGTTEVKGNHPPVTAGGGNGSANTSPKAPTEKEMERWTAEQMGTYIRSNGKIVPKAKA